MAAAAVADRVILRYSGRARYTAEQAAPPQKPAASRDRSRRSELAVLRSWERSPAHRTGRGECGMREWRTDVDEPP